MDGLHVLCFRNDIGVGMLMDGLPCLNNVHELATMSQECS